MEHNQRTVNSSYLGMTLRSLLENNELIHPVPVHQMDKDEKDGSGSEEFDTSAAFLGPNLWDKTLSDFKLEYMELDEFLEENCIPTTESLRLRAQGNRNTTENYNKRNVSSPAPSHLSLTTDSGSYDGSSNHSQKDDDEKEPPEKSKVNVKYKINENELALASVPGKDFDPCNHTFSEDELKPQPMVKKSQKQFVPDDLKDDRYWARRRKNNIAAKRSREARRVKENQIVLRASYLEKENTALKDEMAQMRATNASLLKRLEKYEKP